MLDVLYPESIYLENSAGTQQKRQVTYEQEDTITFEDIEKRKDDLKKSLQAEQEIDEEDYGRRRFRHE